MKDDILKEKKDNNEKQNYSYQTKKIILILHASQTEMLSYVSYHIILHHMVDWFIISYHIISYHVTSYHILSFHIIPCDIISYPIILYHTM